MLTLSLGAGVGSIGTQVTHTVTITDDEPVTWTHEFDFGDGQQSWFVPVPPDRGVWSGSRWDADQNFEGATNNTAVHIARSFAATITRFVVIYNMVAAGTTNIYVYAGASTLIDTASTTGTGLTKEWTGSLNVNHLGVQVAASITSGTPGGSAAITHIRIERTGDNPFD